MPLDLLLVRHGESEGNKALRASKKGDDSHMSAEFLATPSSRWRLTPKGEEQARMAGEWIRREFPQGFDRHYTSEYVRALETAALMQLPRAQWYINPYLRERNWGELDRITDEERGHIIKARVMADKDITPYYWKPPNGESLVEVSSRLRNVLDTMHRECSRQRVVVVAHGEVMESFRIELERMSERQYLAWQEAKEEDPSLKVRNCHIWHYTRRDPDTGEVADYLGWKRAILEGVEGEWQKLSRKRYTSEELLEIAQLSKRLLN